MNRVEIKWNGLRFGQNESYGCQKAFGMPPEAQYNNNKKKYTSVTLTRIFSLGSLAWDLWGISGLDLWLGISGLDLWLGISGLDLWLGISGLGSLAWDLWLGISGLGSPRIMGEPSGA